MEGVVDLIAFGIDPHRHGDTGPFNPFVQRTQIARQSIRQHRHHTVREVSGIAPLAGLSIQSRTGRHIVRHIRNRDPDNKPTLILGVIVGFDKTGVVMIACVGWVNCDQRQFAQIVPFA